MTVQELIAKLQSFNPDATIVIDDADTSYLLHIATVENVPTLRPPAFINPDAVRLTSGYSDIYQRHVP